MHTVVCIGLGRIAWLLESDPLRNKPCTHLGAVTAAKNFKLLAGIDNDADRAASFSRHFKVPAFASLNEFSRLTLKPFPNGEPTGPGQNGQVDLVILAVPEKEHVPLLKESLARLKPRAVVIEKPVCLTRREKNALRRLENDCAVWVNHERRYHPDYLKVARKLQTSGNRLQSLHAVLHAGGRFLPFEQYRQAPNPLYHDGTHLIDAANFFTRAALPAGQKPAWQLHSALFHEKEAHLVYTINGVLCTFTLICSSNYFQFEIDLRLQKSSFKIGNGYLKEYYSRPSPFYKKFRSLASTGGKNQTGRPGHDRAAANKTSPFSGLYAEVDRYLKKTKKGEPSVVSSPLSDGLQVIDQIHAAEDWFARRRG